MGKMLRVRISIAGAASGECKRLLVSSHIKLRKAHVVFCEALGGSSIENYSFQQDGRVFANPAFNDDYVEDDATFSLGYCLCLPGHTMDYVLGGTRHSVELEAIEAAGPKAQAGSCVPLRGET